MGPKQHFHYTTGHMHDEHSGQRNVFDAGSFAGLILFVVVMQANINVYAEKRGRFHGSDLVLTLLANLVMFYDLLLLKSRVMNNYLENQCICLAGTYLEPMIK